MPVIAPLGGDLEGPPAPCAGCGGKIRDQYYLQAVDRQWHLSCLTCCQCKVQLDSERTCFVKDGHIYCKDDYYRLFSVKRCARCQSGIFANELVMRARNLVFHLHCFTCAWCNTALAQGDYFGLRDELVYCRAHYELLLLRDEPIFAPGGTPRPLGETDLRFPSMLDPTRLRPMHGTSMAAAAAQGDSGGGMMLPDRTALGDGPGFASFPTTVGTGRKGRPRKRKNADLNLDGVSQHGVGLSPMDPGSCSLHLSHLEAGSQGSPPLPNGQGGQRTKRMRTSFKHHQLRTMKSYFAINQNPDAKDLKQLAQKTGLSKRVLQVWFQNARAKWRRNSVKLQDPHLMPGDSVQQLGGPMTGGLSSPGATSSFSEPSPVPSCGGGLASDGSLSTQPQQGLTTSMDFDSSDPMTPLVSHHPMNPSSVHNGDNTPLHLTSFHELF